MKRARVRLERALRLHCVKCFQARRISKDGGMRRMHTDRRNKQKGDLLCLPKEAKSHEMKDKIGDLAKARTGTGVL